MRNDYISVLGLYMYDDSLFDNMLLPEVLTDDRTTVINNILMETAEMETLYSDATFLKFAIGEWSKKRIHAWNKMALVLYEEYDPFINIVRDEERVTTETRDLAGSLYNTETRDLSLDTDGTVTLSTNAWDDGSGTERQQETTDSGTTDTGTVTNARSTTDTGTVTRRETYHVQGDSAITDAQDVAKKEIELRQNFDLIEIIISEFKNRFCLLVY